MLKQKILQKTISYSIVILLISTLALSTNSVAMKECAVAETIRSTSQECEINIYGTNYIKKHNPFNMTDGLYIEFIYHGDETIIINITMRLKTVSTFPDEFTYDLAQNLEFPPEVLGQAGIFGINFGIGFFSFSLIIDGCEEFSDIHAQKTAYGICFRYNAFILLQR